MAYIVYQGKRIWGCGRTKNMALKDAIRWGLQPSFDGAPKYAKATRDLELAIECVGDVPRFVFLPDGTAALPYEANGPHPVLSGMSADAEVYGMASNDAAAEKVMFRAWAKVDEHPQADGYHYVAWVQPSDMKRSMRAKYPKGAFVVQSSGRM